MSIHLADLSGTPNYTLRLEFTQPLARGRPSACRVSGVHPAVRPYWLPFAALRNNLPQHLTISVHELSIH